MQHVLERAHGVRLRDILRAGQFFGGDDVRVTSLCGDSRKCRPGDVFVAILGPNEDGHDHAFDAVARGAAAVVAERMLPVRVPVCLVDDTREAYGRLCQTLAGNPSQKLQTIGVTGSHGKTVTSLLIASVLEAARGQVGVTTTLGYSDGFETVAASRTTPQPPELAEWLARMVANDCSQAVVEVCSQSLAQRRLSGVEFDAAVLTNVRAEHLDFHGSVVNYRRAKGRLFEHLKPHGFAVLNADDPASRPFLSQLDCPVMTYSLKSDAELTAEVLERHPSEQTFLLSAGHESIPVCTRRIGDAHVSYCLAAAAVGLVLGIDLPTIVRGLENVDRVPGRMERLECGQGFGVFVDGARSSDALSATLRTLRQSTRGRVLCVFGAPGQESPEDRPLLGRAAEKHAHLSIVTNVDSHDEEPLQIAHDILDGMDRPERAQVIPSRHHAIDWALNQAKPGDCVLIAGRGHDTCVVGNRVLSREAELVRSRLYAKA